MASLDLSWCSAVSASGVNALLACWDGLGELRLRCCEALHADELRFTAAAALTHLNLSRSALGEGVDPHEGAAPLLRSLCGCGALQHVNLGW